MKQKLLQKTLLLLFALIAGSTSVWATNVTINFGTTTGYWAAHNSATYSDSDSRTWTRVCSVTNMSGQAEYSQFGNASNTPTVTLTATAGSDMTLTAFSVTMNGASGGASPTTGTIYLYKKSGATETQLATASVNGTSAVICSITSSQAFSSTDQLEVKYVGTTKAVRVTQLSYSYTTSGGGSSVSAPTFSPGSSTVTAGSKVSISHADADAIRYTTDGTNPDKTTGTVYNSPITITTATTIKAVAIKGDDVSSVATAAYTISVAAPTFSLSGGSYLEGTTVTLTSAGNTIYYTTDGSEPSSTSTEYTGPIAIAAGEYTYRAIAYDAYGNSSSVTPRTYTGITPASLPFSWTGTSEKGKADLAEQAGVVANLASDYAASNAPYRLKFDGTSKYVIIYTNEKPETVSFTAKLFNAASTGSKMKVQASADGIDFTDIQEFTIKGDANATFDFTTTNPFAATDRVVKIALSYKEQNVGVGSISIGAAPVPVTITTADYATFCSTKDLDFSETGITVYQAKVESNKVKFTEVSDGLVKAGEGVLLYKDVNAETVVNVPVTTGVAALSENELVGVTAETAVAYNPDTDVYNYILQMDGANLVFRKATGDKLRANRAYLSTSYDVTASGARELEVSFGDETAINALENSNKVNDGAIYDLSGRRVENPTKGIYIMNGKKFVVK